MCGPSTLEQHVVPVITAAAGDAGREPPTIGAGFPVCVTDDPDAARVAAASTFAIYGQLPSYRAMLDREDAAGPADVAIVGDEAAVSAQLERLRVIGVTDFVVSVFGTADDRARTYAYLASLL
jgi:alkanesulfonate monooxygenase SsuD/methylene tetrahydromethanopterin reductase-like flavin-dependent oxidoreductase (luciferase family)